MMVRLLPISICVALAAGIAWLGRTLYIEELRHPFLFSVFGGDPKLNAAWLSTESMLPCTNLEVIYARGSTEPSPIGYLLGPKLKQALEEQLGIDPKDILVVGLDYMANFVLPDSLDQGIERLTERVKRRAKQCPDMGFAIAGYSQGAEVIRSAIQDLTEVKDHIRAIVVFGDPLTSVGWPAYYTGRVLNLCNPGDRGCGGNGLFNHFTYGAKGNLLHEAAAEFISEKAKDRSMQRDGAAKLKKLPERGEAAVFLLPWKDFPPPEWKTKFTDGVQAKTVGLRGVSSLVDIWG